MAAVLGTTTVCVQHMHGKGSDTLCCAGSEQGTTSGPANSAAAHLQESTALAVRHKKRTGLILACIAAAPIAIPVAAAGMSLGYRLAGLLFMLSMCG